MTTFFTTKGIVFSALFSALFVISSYLNIHLGFTPIPISLENLVVMLAGAILGPVYGFLSMALVVVLTALGLPLNGSGGLTKVLGPTGGFLWAFPFAAFFIGLFVKKIKTRGTVHFILLFLVLEVFGSLLVYVTGVPWLSHAAKMPMEKAMVVGCYPYLPGDAVKAVIAAIILQPVRKIFPMERIVGAAKV
jgi:biotin transport system substrate-specific component